MARVYKDYFDISYNLQYALDNKLAFCIAVSEDSQRGCGKTYSTAAELIRRYKEYGHRFYVLVREVRELGKMAEGMMDQLLSDKYENTRVFEKKQENIFSYIYIEEGVGEEKTRDLLGYCICLRNAKNIKNYRGLLQSSNIKYGWFDEFQPLDGKYLDGEVDVLFPTIYDTINPKCEPLPMILTANCINIGNPWFTHILDSKGRRLTSLIQSNTKRLKTDTCIYENVTVEGLSEKHMNSAMNIALGRNTVAYKSNVWIGDDNSLVASNESWGRGTYLATLRFENQSLSVLSYPQVGYYYVGRKIDSSCPYVYNLKMEGELNIPLLKTNSLMVHLRDCFYKGEVRVADNTIQRILLDTL